MVGNDVAIKERTEVLEKLLVYFENGRSSSNVAEELFAVKNKLKSTTFKKAKAIGKKKK